MTNHCNPEQKNTEPSSDSTSNKPASRYKTTYTTRAEPRDANIFPRTGSFVELELAQNSHENKQSHTHIFSCLTNQESNFGCFGTVHKFTRYGETKATDSLSNVKTLAVKKIQYQGFLSYWDEIYFYFINKSLADPNARASACRDIHGFGEYTHDHNQNEYYCGEFFEGKTLYSCLTENITETDRVKILLAIINELERIHRLQYVHGDLHAGNIILKKQDEQWIAKLIDFDFTYENNQPLSWRAKILGAYDRSHAAPEIKGLHCSNARYAQDIFSLGRIIYLISLPSKRESFALSTDPYLNLLGEQITRDDPEKRPSLRTIKTLLNECLSNISIEKKTSPEKRRTESARNVVKLFLTDQIRLLTLQENKKSKGAHEKKAHFSALLTELTALNFSKPNAEDAFDNIFMKVAIVAHHQRRRTRDQLASFTLFGPSCADSWSIWTKIQFPNYSKYQILHRHSLIDKSRNAYIDDKPCHTYEQLRHQALPRR